MSNEQFFICMMFFLLPQLSLPLTTAHLYKLISAFFLGYKMTALTICPVVCSCLASKWNISYDFLLMFQGFYFYSFQKHFTLAKAFGETQLILASSAFCSYSSPCLLNCFSLQQKGTLWPAQAKPVPGHTQPSLARQLQLCPAIKTRTSWAVLMGSLQLTLIYPPVNTFLLLVRKVHFCSQALTRVACLQFLTFS